MIEVSKQSRLHVYDGTSDMEATNDYKGYEAQSQGRGGQGGNCIIWQNIYLYCSTTLRVSILPEVTNIKILRNEIL